MGQVRNLAIALLATDEEVEAVALFRKLQQMERGPWPPEPYAQYLAFHGRADELEELIRQSIEAVPADRVEERNRVRQELELHRGWACIAQGRFAEAWRFIQTLPMIQKNPALLEEQRVGRGQSTGNTDLIRQALVELDRLGALDDPETFGSVAFSLAVGGPLELAAPFAERAMSSPRYLDVPPPARPLIEASVDWARGDLDAAERKITATERGPGQNFRLAAARMHAKLANARGDCPRVVASLEPVRALRYSMLANSRLWDLPEALHSLALCYERMGDLPKARERNAEMLKRWEKADEDIPLLIEAKAMRQRLAVK